MDLQDNYIVTSHEGSASNFVSNFAYPIRVGRGHKIALKSICYGPKWNVTDKNNKLWLDVEDKEPHVEYATIKNGWYAGTYDLFIAISKAVNVWTDVFNEKTGNNLEHSKVGLYTTGSLDDVKLIFSAHCGAVHSAENVGILSLFQFSYGNYTEIVTALTYFSEHYPAFVYANVVENSYINNKASRLLAIIPMQSGYIDGSTGYHFYVFSSPSYYNFGIREFSHIVFQLIDENGELIDFDPKFKTIIALEVFKPLNISL